MPPVRWPEPTDRPLIERLLGTLPLSERPFADIGGELGLREDMVIDRLHQLLAQGVLEHFGPLYVAAAGSGQPKFPVLQLPLAEFERDLVAATASGLPLLARPYEAVGAMLGTSGTQVREQLALMLQQGRLQRIGVVVAAGADPADEGPRASAP
jgi:DNA-binding Lrp family transcriptional regulator